MLRDDYIKEINRALANLSREIEINSSLNLTDLNIHSENFFREFLNILLGYSLVNINAINPNADAIDLGDQGNKIAIQVTSTSALAKTRETVKKFIKNELFNTYDRLVILNIVKSSKHREKMIGEEGVFQVDTQKDMWDYLKLAKLVNDKTFDEIEKLHNFVKKELMSGEGDRPPKEVQTIISLIDYLSNRDAEDSKTNFSEDPDPNRKIHRRFSQYADFLKSKYIMLYQLYGDKLRAAESVTDIGTVQVVKKSLYLQFHTDKVLNDFDGNPRKALDALTEEFSTIVRRRGHDCDEIAVTFFLVTEMIRCNVFPNEEAINA